MFTANSRIAVLLHDGLGDNPGKTGLALIRYRPEQIAVVIDQNSPGQSFWELTRIPVDVPIVASMADAVAYKPDWLAIGIAPSGGVLPAEWLGDVALAVEQGLSIANGLHTKMATQFDTKAGQIVWDIRQEPPGLKIASAAARNLTCKRVLAVGTDMNVGKMSACLELYRSAQAQGLKAKFLGTGQAGIMIAGAGVPLDAVRVDFAAGAIEGMVLDAADGADMLFIEGQGSLLHPGSTATLPLMRGTQPTHLILVHRAGQTHVNHHPHVLIPDLPKVIKLYETVALAGGAFAPVKVAGIALNTARLNPADAVQAITQVKAETGLPCTDVVRFGGVELVQALS